MKKAEVRKEYELLKRQYEEKLKKLARHKKATERRSHVQHKLQEIAAADTDGGSELSQDGISQPKKKTQRLTFAEPLIYKQRKKHGINLDLLSLSLQNSSYTDTSEENQNDPYNDSEQSEFQPNCTTCGTLVPTDDSKNTCTEDQCCVPELEVSINCPDTSSGKGCCAKFPSTAEPEKLDGTSDVNGCAVFTPSRSNVSVSFEEVDCADSSELSEKNVQSCSVIKRCGGGRKRKRKHNLGVNASDSVSNDSSSICCETDGRLSSGDVTLECEEANGQNDLINTYMTRTLPSHASECSAVVDSQSDLFEHRNSVLLESQSTNQDGQFHFPAFPSDSKLYRLMDFSLPDDEYGNWKLQKLNSKLNISATNEARGTESVMLEVDVCQSLDSVNPDTCNLDITRDGELSDVIMNYKVNPEEPDIKIEFTASHPSEGELLNLSSNMSNEIETRHIFPPEGQVSMCVQNSAAEFSREAVSAHSNENHDMINLVDCIPLHDAGKPGCVCAMTAGVVTKGTEVFPFLVVCHKWVEVILFQNEEWMSLCHWELDVRLPATSVHPFPRSHMIAFTLVCESGQSSSARILACDTKGNKSRTLGSLCDMSVKSDEESPSIQCLIQGEQEVLLSSSARGTTVLRKFVFADEYTRIKDHVIFSAVSDHIKSLVAVQAVTAVVLGASKDTAYLWNSNSGILLSRVTLPLAHPLRTCVAAYSEKGLVFLPVLSCSEVEDNVSMIVLNPSSRLSKLAISYEAGMSKRLASLAVFKKYLIGLHACGDVTVWDLCSGDTTATLDRGHIQFTSVAGPDLSMFLTAVCNEREEVCIHVYRES